MGVPKQREVGLEEQINDRQAPFVATLVQHQLVYGAVRAGQLGRYLHELGIRAEVVLGGAALVQVGSVGSSVDVDPSSLPLDVAPMWPSEISLAWHGVTDHETRLPPAGGVRP